MNKVNEEFMTLTGRRLRESFQHITLQFATISHHRKELVIVMYVSDSVRASVGTDHRITSAYHPQSNGLVERLNQTLQNTLMKQVNDHQNNWDELLDPALFAIRTSKQKSTKYTPFELMFNRYDTTH